MKAKEFFKKCLKDRCNHFTVTPQISI